jgi:formylglycine-generating enzyme required for sulfatase activity
VRNVEEGSDPRALALLQVQNPPAGLQAIEPAPDWAVAAGTAVVVAGFPSAIGAFTVLRATVASIKGRDFYLTPTTEEGFSGGPVLLEDRAVGLVFGREAAFGKAVPAAIVSQYLRGHDITWGTQAAKRVLAKPAELAPGAVRINPNDGQAYVWIPPGEFQMGCSPRDKECRDNESPPRKVRLSRSFWLGQTEVTVGAYKQYAAKMGVSLPAEPVSRPPNLTVNPGWSDLEQPMVNITWQQAKFYCESWARGRLPTEAEWEYAERAGTTEARYGELDAIAWHKDDSGDAIRRVKQKQPNAWSLYDMLGNVYEWTADWYAEKYYSTGPSVDPQGPAGGEFRVLRGGWGRYPWSVRASYRYMRPPDSPSTSWGVRCACDRLP